MWGVVLAITVSLLAGLVFHAERKEYKVHGKGIVLVTGASTGIGRDAAEYLSKNTGFLVLAGVRKESDYQSILESNQQMLPFMIDVSSHESCVNAVTKIQELTEKYDLPFVGLVNNAGIGGNFSPLEYQDMGFARTLFDTNVFGLLDLTQQALPLLRASQGRIVMISSLSGIFAIPLSGVYSASKFALEALSDTLRRELAVHNVSVSVVEPGYVKTAIIQTSLKSIQTQSAEILALYPSAAVSKRQGMAEMMDRMPGPEVTTTPAIVHALTSAYPKTRYPVAQASGLQAKVLTWVSWGLSDRIKDMVFK